MAIEFFEIKWTGYFSLDNIQGRTESWEKGIYAVYKSTEVYYIGMTTEFGDRLKSHRRNWAHILGEAKVKKLRVCVGVVTAYKGTHPSQVVLVPQLRSLESFLINYKTKKPEGNPPTDKRGYHGKMSPVIVNTGKIGNFDKIIFHNQAIEKLLRTSLTPKKRKNAYDW